MNSLKEISLTIKKDCLNSPFLISHFPLTGYKITYFKVYLLINLEYVNSGISLDNLSPYCR